MYSSITGTIIPGDKIGTPFGIATANIKPEEHKLLESGVYFVHVELPSKTSSLRKQYFSGIMHYGELKTFAKEFRIEVHILHFNQNIYHQSIIIHPLKYHREVKKFKNSDQLFTQIELDIVKAEKFFLRKKIETEWNNVSKEDHQKMIKKVIQEIKSSSKIKSAQNIGIYAPIKDKELNIASAIEELFPEKKLSFPFPEDDYKLSFYESKTKDLHPGKYNIPEPPKKILVPLADIDLLIVPLVAGNQAGERLGRGGGYYDRLLQKYTGPSLSILPEFANIKHIPTERHDQTIDEIIFV